MSIGPPGSGNAVFTQQDGDGRLEAEPLSQVSIELGLLDGYVAGSHESMASWFSRLVPWVDAARQDAAANARQGRARVSTCLLLNDYHTTMSAPAVLMPKLVGTAEAAGLVVDYVGRASALAEAPVSSPAQLLVGRLVSEPPPGTLGDRPPLAETGWLTNGLRSSPLPAGQTLPGSSWQPPAQTAAAGHSIFADIELWDQSGVRERWSMALLTAAWQVLRLGMLRDQGRVIVRPMPWDGSWPQTWTELPPILQLSARAAPFAAYRTVSVLAGFSMPLAYASRTILEQFAVDEALDRAVTARAADERLDLPGRLLDRMSHVLL